MLVSISNTLSNVQNKVERQRGFNEHPSLASAANIIQLIQISQHFPAAFIKLALDEVLFSSDFPPYF